MHGPGTRPGRMVLLTSGIIDIPPPVCRCVAGWSCVAGWLLLVGGGTLLGF